MEANWLQGQIIQWQSIRDPAQIKLEKHAPAASVGSTSQPPDPRGISAETWLKFLSHSQVWLLNLGREGETPRVSPEASGSVLPPSQQQQQWEQPRGAQLGGENTQELLRPQATPRRVVRAPWEEPLGLGMNLDSLVPTMGINIPQPC